VCHCSFFICLLFSPIIKYALISYLHYYLGKSRLAGKLKEVIDRVINIFHAQKELNPFPGGLGKKKGSNF